jgi:hypothetical protein
MRGLARQTPQIKDARPYQSHLWRVIVTRRNVTEARTMSETGDSIELAARRLERAVVMLEQRLSRLSGEAEAGGLFDQDRSKLASELDAARARERELADAGEQASLALGRAIAEIRAALGEQGEGAEEAA